MAEQEEQDNDARGAEHVWRVVAAVVGGAMVIMTAWGAWVLHWAARTRPEVPGTFGDSFAPIVGLMTAGALGAAIASVFMQRRELELQRQEMQLQRDEMKAQREEMEEARKQWTAQAASMAEANVYAADANKLAAGAQLLEASRQISELDRMASDLVDSVRPAYSGEDYFKDASSMWVWLKYAKASDEERGQAFPAVFDAPEFHALRHRRSMLVRVAARVSTSFDT